MSSRDRVAQWRAIDGGQRNRLMRRMEYERSKANPDYAYLAQLSAMYRELANQYRRKPGPKTCSQIETSP